MFDIRWTASVLFSLTLVACAGEDGRDTLVRSTPEPEGVECPYGGVRLDFGHDDDDNRVLDDDEVADTSFVCHVLADGKTSRIRVSREEAGARCPMGGQRIESGLDVDDDGVLTDDEVRALAILCDGVDGEDGDRSLVAVDGLSADPGGACYFGGVLIRSGLDGDGDGVLSAEETEHEQAVCSIHVNENLTLVENSVELPGTQCEFGGIRVVVGYDADGDNILDPEEADPPSFICNELVVVDGKTALFETRQASGNQCAYGGHILTSGLDDDRDGSLDAGEVDQTLVLCNGSDGVNSVVETVDAGSQCGPEGGVVMTSGLDLNHDGRLNPNEVQASDLICNGQDGFLGYDGFSSLIRVEDGGGACGAYGGYRMLTGLDLNDDGYLGGGEVEYEAYLCHGADGHNTLVELSDGGAYCPEEGVLIESGLDVNDDGYLSGGEVEHAEVVCDGL